MASALVDGDSTPPTDAELASLLGAATGAWERLRRDLMVLCEPHSEEWRFARSAGWVLRVKRGSRIIVYLTPQQGQVLASFALGGRAVAAVLASDLPAKIAH